MPEKLDTARGKKDAVQIVSITQKQTRQFVQSYNHE